MTVESLIALIPALPLVGFLFAVLVGPRIDRIPTHGHDAHDDRERTAQCKSNQIHTGPR